jgi:hypothetical protein
MNSMPRKPLDPFKEESDLDSEARTALANEVRAMMKRFDEFAVLEPTTAGAFGSALAKAIRFARMGCPVKRSDVSGLEWTQEILAFDVADAMRSAGLPVRSWRQDTVCRDPEQGEALYYRVLRATAALAGFNIPVDAFRLKKRAERITRTKHGDIVNIIIIGAPNAPSPAD